jgi:hypothetical protein
VWSGPYGEEFAPDKSASAGTDDQAELLTVIVSGSSRRNVSGAIALEKNDGSFPRQRQPESSRERDRSERQPALSEAPPDQQKRNQWLAQRYRYAKNSEENRFGLTDSFRKGPTRRRSLRWSM